MNQRWQLIFTIGVSFKIAFIGLFFGTLQAQIMPEDEFHVGKHFLKNECRVETHPDWGDITFLTDRIFLASLAIQNNDSSFLIGKYELHNGILTLKSIRSAMPLWYSDSLNNRKLEYFKNLKFNNVRFRVSKCESGEIIMTQLGKQKLWYASRDKKNRKFWIEQLKSRGLWGKLTEY